MTAQARLLGGRYQVGELLGYGGMAEVHRGRDLRLGRDVAIKMLRTDLARDATFQERFRREAQNSAALNHPAIVAVYDTGEEISAIGEKQPFIVMEFVNGQTLKELLAQEHQLQPRRALEIIADICAALEFSHRHGIIHRDVKPGNVMITRNGQVKVMDFGIARALASGATTMTQTSAVIGTAQYLSPEQARGEPVDARSDVYAAGCVLFELVVGHPPFIGDSPVSVAYQHVREDPKAPSDLNPEVPPDVDAIVLKALAKNPLNRYQSSQEMRADALRAVAGRPVLATPVMSQAETMAMQNQMPQRQWQQQGATTMQRPMPPVGGPRPPERRGSSSWVWASLAALGVLAVVVLAVALATRDNKNGGTTATQSPTTAAAFAMPGINGQDPTTAQKILTQAGFTNVTPKQTQDSSCDGNVSNQNPAQNTQVTASTPVTYTICSKPDQVAVPDVTGQQKSAAEKQLEGLGFKVHTIKKASSAPENQVLSVEDGGQNAPAGATLDLTYSDGSLIKVPDVSTESYTRDGATSVLRQNNLKANVGTITGTAGTPGTVVHQSPAAGTEVPKGSVVEIDVLQGDGSNPSGSPSPSDTPTDGNGNGN